MSFHDFSFETERLVVREWASFAPSEWQERSLPDVVVRVMTAKVTASLPEDWQGAFSRSRAVEWIQERDREGVTLMVVSRASRLALGFMILHLFEDGESERSTVRLGYLLSESSWGQGLGSELIAGFLKWARGAGVASVLGGVAADHLASQRVLEKNGFVVVESPESGPSGELLFEWIP